MSVSMELDRFAGMIAHELRNPLASATTNLAVAADLMEETDPRSAFIRRAEKEMDRIRLLLDACIELATAGRIDRRDVSLPQLLQDAAEGLVPSRNGDVELRLDVAGTPRARIDPSLMQRAIGNLIENAVKAFGGEPGTIGISASRTGNEVRFTVEDSGPGIPEELRARIFDPLVTGLKGSGLGLAFVKKVVEAHGGTIEVGRGELGGARFEIRIPEEE